MNWVNLKSLIPKAYGCNKLTKFVDHESVKKDNYDYDYKR